MKKYLTYIGGFLGILVAGGLIWWGIREYQYRKSPDYQVMKYYNDLADQYAKDTYGGDTPEETLQLFIDALKKGDVELASKYFIPQKQKEWLENFKKIKEAGKFDEMMADLMRVEKYNQTDEQVFFVAGNEKKQVVVNMVMYKNINKKWKISEL